MSTDTDEKTQSKFPRASLRARNKTLMITPADVADFQVEPDDSTALSSDLADVLDDSLGSLTETAHEIPGISSHGSDRHPQGVTEEEEEEMGDALGALSADWDNENLEEEVEEPDHGDTVQQEPASKPDDIGDIFAAPQGAVIPADTLFAPIQPKDRGDQIVPVRVSTLSADSFVTTQSQDVTDYGSAKTSYSQGTGSIRVLQDAARAVNEAPRPGEAARAREYVDWKKPSKLIGFLVSYSSDSMGSYSELREGRLLVTCEKSPNDSCFVISDESVSPMHAIMRIASDGSILILDQLSEHGTRIRRASHGKEEALMGDKSSLSHGDVVIFGECEYHVVVVGTAAIKMGE